MENSSVVDMIDEEISRLIQVREILQSLSASEAIAFLPSNASAEQTADETKPEPAPAPVRYTSRRGIATGRRGPRRRVEAVAPRPLDAPVPIAPVVVKRAMIVVAKPAVASAAPQAADGTLEALVRSLRPELRGQMVAHP